MKPDSRLSPKSSLFFACYLQLYSLQTLFLVELTWDWGRFTELCHSVASSYPSPDVPVLHAKPVISYRWRFLSSEFGRSLVGPLFSSDMQLDSSILALIVWDLFGCNIYLSCFMTLWRSKTEKSNCRKKVFFWSGSAQLASDAGCVAHVQSSVRCACHRPFGSFKFATYSTHLQYTLNITGQHTLHIKLYELIRRENKHTSNKHSIPFGLTSLTCEFTSSSLNSWGF